MISFTVVHRFLCADEKKKKPDFATVAGKKFVPKEPERTRVDDDDAVDTEWDEILSAASEEELVDLAGKLIMIIQQICYTW